MMAQTKQEYLRDFLTRAAPVMHGPEGSYDGEHDLLTEIIEELIEEDDELRPLWAKLVSDADGTGEEL